MELQEHEIYEALGVEEPTPEETPPGEGAAPEEQAPPEGGESGAGGVNEPEGETAPAGEHQEEPAPMTEEERHRQATARREQERIEAEQAKNAAIDQAYAAAFAGRKNPYNGQDITTKAEYEQYQAQYQADQQRQQLERMKAAGVDPAAIQSIVDQHPAIQQAQLLMQQAEAERVKAQEAQAKGWFGEQLKQINALDPEAKVGSLDELAAKAPEKYSAMLGMVARGVSMVDAYKMTHFDELAQRRAAAAQQTVRNQAAGKAHLTASGGQGKAGVEVPASVREEFRALMPGITDEEIRRQYADYMNKTK